MINSKIDATWNPVKGCTRISPGCMNCYAERQAARFAAPGRPFHLFADPERSGSKWTGKVEIVEKHLADPLKWKAPRRIFVNSMSDLFHENLSFDQIDRVWEVMLAAPQHTYQVLTKRAARMHDYLNGHTVGGKAHYGTPPDWIWCGVSVEDQSAADQRITFLLDTPTAVRFLSCEPLLGVIRLRQVEQGAHYIRHGAPGIDWVIIGGESGPGARPCAIAWIEELVQDCQWAGVPVFLKQFGAFPRGVDGNRISLHHRKGGDPAEWPLHLRIREFPGVRR